MARVKNANHDELEARRAADDGEVPTFADLVFGQHPMGGKLVRVHFLNGYGASVVQFNGSYGGNDDLYEIAVLHGDRLCYETPVTDDVLGYLSEDDVTAALADIAALPVPA